jgi:hypothetical protein
MKNENLTYVTSLARQKNVWRVCGGNDPAFTLTQKECQLLEMSRPLFSLLIRQHVTTHHTVSGDVALLTPLYGVPTHHSAPLQPRQQAPSPLHFLEKKSVHIHHILHHMGHRKGTHKALVRRPEGKKGGNIYNY